MKTYFSLFMLCFVLLSGIAAQDSQSAAEVRAINGVTLLADSVGQYDKVEMVVDLDATYNNPYDPQEIRLDAKITSPSDQTIDVAGFYMDEFTYDKQVAPTGKSSWRVRFTPIEVGTYRYQVVAATGDKTVESATGTFTVTASDNPGFVRVDPRNPRYFAFDNGAPYFPIGLNVAWSTGDTISDYEAWLDALQASGGNYIRVWMAPWNMSIEWIETGLGNYTRRQFHAYELDRVIEMAEQRGVYILLSLINHGQFNTDTNPEWNDNPYNAANGGPCASPECFATNPDAVRFWQQRLRYIVARWGYSTHIMTWEWWNEINWTPLAGEPIIGPWIEQNSALLREIDPYDHLQSHSGSPSAMSSVWAPLDFAQDHYYDKDDFPRTFQNVLEEWSSAYPDKPFIVGEFGRGSGALEYDLQGDELHLGIWGAPMNGAAGTAMSWWWDTYIDPNNLWNTLYKGVSSFFKDEDLGAHPWQPVTADFAERTKARVFGLQAEDTALVWVVSKDYTPRTMEKAYLKYLRNKKQGDFTVAYPDVEGAVLVVSGLADGSYAVEIWDTFAGTVLDTKTIDSAGGALSVPLPTFNRDLALKVKHG